MSNKNKSFFKTAAITGAVIGSACAAAGNAFIDRFLSRNGIKKTAAAGGELPFTVKEFIKTSSPLTNSAFASIRFSTRRKSRAMFTQSPATATRAIRLKTAFMQEDFLKWAIMFCFRISEVTARASTTTAPWAGLTGSILLIG